MKVKVFLISGLLTIFSMAQVWASNLDLDNQATKANLIKLASAEILEKNINKVLGSSHFLEKTQLHTDLGGTIRFLDEIGFIIDLNICGYINIIKNDNIFPHMVDVIERELCMKRHLLKISILNSSQPDQDLD